MSAACAISRQGLKPRVQWCRGGEFNGPPGPYARVKSAVNAVFARYIKPDFAAWRSHGKSPVVTLLLGRAPHTVLELVIAVYINALYRQMIGVSAHFGPARKVLEIGPILTNGYASPAVVGPLWMIGPSASRTHSLPDAVNPTAALSVRFGALTGFAVSFASAGLRFSFSKVAAYNVADVAACAFAAPKGCASGSVPALRDNAPKSKRLASQIYKPRVFCHAPLYKDGVNFATGDWA